jgi:hypothetical protein
VRHFNESRTDAEKQFEVDQEVIKIRDAFAHRRLVTENEFPARLWKFGIAKDGRVPIEFCEKVSTEWLKTKVQLIFKQKEKVVDYFESRGYQGIC